MRPSLLLAVLMRAVPSFAALPNFPELGAGNEKYLRDLSGRIDKLLGG